MSISREWLIHSVYYVQYVGKKMYIDAHTFLKISSLWQCSIHMLACRHCREKYIKYDIL